MSNENTLNDSLAVILEKAIAGVENGVNFLSSEIPEVARQILEYSMYRHTMLLILFGLIFLGSFSSGFLFVFKNREKTSSEGYFFGWLFICLSSLPMLVSVHHFFRVLKISMAPKLYLIEYASEIIK